MARYKLAMLGILRCCRNKVQTTLPTRILRRPYSAESTKEQALRKLDKIPDNYQLVYNDKWFSYFKYILYATNIATSFVLFRIVQDVCMQVFRNPNRRKEKFLFDFRDPLKAYFVMLAVTFVPITANTFCRRVPMRIYRDHQSKRYRAVFMSKLPFMQSTHYEMPEQSLIHSPKNFQMFSFSAGNMFTTHTHRRIIFNDCFKTADDFHDLIKVFRRW